MEVVFLDRKKRTTYWMIVIILISGSWIGNMWYYMHSQLEEPLFLRHHITMFGNMGDQLELQYLENKSGDIQVSMIQIDELPQLRFQLYEHSRYTHQVLKKAVANWSPEELDLEENTNLTIHEITVYYNNGQSERFSIGDINVLWYPNNHNVLEYASGGASSDGTGFIAVKAAEDITIEGIHYTYPDKMPAFEMKLANTPLDQVTYPFLTAERHGLNLNYRWRYSEDNPYRYDVFRSKIVLNLRLENEQAVTEYLHITQNLYFSESDIRRLVRSGGAY